MVLYAHGLEGHPRGKKAQALLAAGLDVTAPDCRGMALATRIAMLDAALDRLDRPILVGSSYGGLAALALIRRRASELAGLVLCAPALIRVEPPVDDPETLVVPADLPCICLHGTHDDIIPLEASQRLVLRSPHVRLIERDDDHRLSNSLDALVDAVRSLQT
jgi:alpha-beta hydrolase superfamily lysophospholipase